MALRERRLPAPGLKCGDLVDALHAKDSRRRAANPVAATVRAGQFVSTTTYSGAGLLATYWPRDLSAS